jgi:hypothetical protein
MTLNNSSKVLLIMACMGLSFVGFLIKLPAVFSHYDKELHTLFYFSAAAFLNLLLSNKNIIRHVLIFITLYLFSVGIEFAQAYSNKFFHKRIHGRYDVEDIHANVKGLVLFSILWLIYVVITVAYSKSKVEKIEDVNRGV